MQQHYHFPGQPNQFAPKQRSGIGQLLQLTCLTVLFIVPLIMFGCAIIIVGVVNQTVSFITIRPTSTRTALLTAMPNSQQSWPTFVPPPLSTSLPITKLAPLPATPSATPTIIQPSRLVFLPVLMGNRPPAAIETPTASALALVGTPVPVLPASTPTSVPASNDSPVATATVLPPTATLTPPNNAEPAATTTPITPTPAPPNSDEPVATATVLPPGPTPTPVNAGWTFNGLARQASNTETSLLYMGELVNSTGAPQSEIVISGDFYDQQGEIAADTLDVISYVPVDPIPTDAYVPFYLLVNGSQEIDHVDLHTRSEPADTAPRQDFQFLEVEQWIDNVMGYCLSGQIANQGPPLQEYLIILAIGYDDQGDVVNFGEHYVDNLPENGTSGSDFEMCLDPFDRQFSHHDLIAFGE